MVIKVGIVGDKLIGWQLLLDQIGVPYVIIEHVPTLYECSAIVVGDCSDNDLIGGIQKYLAGGGAVVCSGKIFAHISVTKSTKTFIKFLFAKEISQFDGIGLIDVDSCCYIPDNSNEVKTSEGKFSVFTGTFGNGQVVVLPFDAGELVLDSRTSVRSFYADHRRLPFEHVSRVSKGNLLKLVSRSLEFLHHHRGFPFVHKWYFPEDAPTIFSYRIDTDYADRNEIEKLYEVICANEIPASWFVDVKSQQEFLSVFKSMNGQEIGIHCYEHSVHRDYARNLINIHNAIKIFKQNDLKANGFAAPLGLWNKGIAKAVNECGFEFSSEFSYDYDNVPSFPPDEETFSKTLQIPVHPISIGNLRRQGFTENEMTIYYHNLLSGKLLAREPIFLYHHPKNNHETVMKSIFDFVDQYKIKSMRMIDYAHWWKKRNATAMQLGIDNQTLRVDFQDMPPNVWLHLTRANGTEAFTSIKQTIDFQKLEWKQKPKLLKLPDFVGRERKFNPWISINRMEDFVSKIFNNLIEKTST